MVEKYDYIQTALNLRKFTHELDRNRTESRTIVQRD